MRKRLPLFLLVLALAACAARRDVSPAAIPTDVGPTPIPTLPTPLLPEAPPSEDIHAAEGAGRWYPADAATLRASVEAYAIQAGGQSIPGRLIAVIVPHAGYIYSGSVAGYSFRALQDAGCAGQTVVVIGDTHTGAGSSAIAVWAAGAFDTPLGRISVDEEVASALVQSDPRIQFDRAAFQAEHPIENQLPFIQVVCPGARIVPIVIRQPTIQNAQMLADALARALIGHQALIVASTDLSHYYGYDKARTIDEVALQSILSLDPQAIVDSPRRCTELGIAEHPGTMCSMGAVMTALIAARQMGADQAGVLHYANSGDSPAGDRSNVVGYGAVAIWQSPSESAQPAGYAMLQTPQQPADLVPLPPDAQRELLDLARSTAHQFLTSQTFPPYETDDPALLQAMGAYVTYREGGDLRGCLGRLEGDRPAYLNVQFAAAAAAVADSRFTPIATDELEALSIEITLLGPMRQVGGPNEIQIGRDGILMRVGEDKSALFLPQVPGEQGWDLADTLLNLCRKAGLADDVWQSPEARFYVFSGQWFAEEAPPP